MSLYGLADALQNVTDFSSLLHLLESKLNWPLDRIDFEDAVFDYLPEEAGLSGVAESQVHRIAQLAQVEDIDRHKMIGVNDCVWKTSNPSDRPLDLTDTGIMSQLTEGCFVNRQREDLQFNPLHCNLAAYRSVGIYFLARS